MPNTYKYVQDWLADEESTLELLTSNSPPKVTPVGCIGAVGGKELYMNSGTKWDLIAPSALPAVVRQGFTNTNKRAVQENNSLNLGDTSGSNLFSIDSTKEKLTALENMRIDISLEVTITATTTVSYTLKLLIALKEYRKGDTYFLSSGGTDTLTFTCAMTLIDYPIQKGEIIKAALGLDASLKFSDISIIDQELRIRSVR